VQLLTTPEQVRAATAGLARAGQRLALVPTMGFLHQGHLSLMSEGKRRAGTVAATIFVNPTQFGPTEDLSRYPRDLEGDLRRCSEVGVDYVYAPAPAVVYPPGFQTTVSVARVSQGLCGDRRPGHFAGVATVVAKLLALFRPEVALFGEKDWQQLQVIRRLTLDLELGVEIVGQPTVREPDGLALSSRNAYLEPSERQRAVSLSRGLRVAQRAAGEGETGAGRLVGLVRAELAEAGVREDYVEVRSPELLEPLERLSPGVPARALVAAFVGKTRLIDNVELLVPAKG
jgi:pantoate--beta-alanine ligase